jgi:translation initiation factor IF-1
MDRFAPGQKVTLQVSPFDLSEGRIVLEKEKSADSGRPIERE